MVQHDDVLVGMLGIMAVVLDSMMLCCAAYFVEWYAVQHVEFSDMMYSMMMCWSYAEFSGMMYSMMLYFAANFVKRYAVQYVEFSGMWYSMMMCWSACWVSWLLCWTA